MFAPLSATAVATSLTPAPDTPGLPSTLLAPRSYVAFQSPLSTHSPSTVVGRVFTPLMLSSMARPTSTRWFAFFGSSANGVENCAVVELTSHGAMLLQLVPPVVLTRMPPYVYSS